jgi:anti-sigma factor RsiW
MIWNFPLLLEADMDVSQGECPYRAAVSSFHDGELDEPRQRELQVHLRRCADCALELKRLEALSSMLDAGRLPPLSPTAQRRFRNVAAFAPQARTIRLARWLTAAAAAVFLTASIQLWIHRGDRPGGAGSGTQTVDDPRPHDPDETPIADWSRSHRTGSPASHPSTLPASAPAR